MKLLSDTQLRALEYIRNTGGNCPVRAFDEDHEPIGPMLRRDLEGYFEISMDTDVMKLTSQGEKAIANDKEG